MLEGIIIIRQWPYARKVTPGVRPYNLTPGVMGVRVGCCLACRELHAALSRGSCTGREKLRRTNEGQHREWEGAKVPIRPLRSKKCQPIPTRRRLRAEVLLFRAQRLTARLDGRDFC
jgi:hypothetical protein